MRLLEPQMSHTQKEYSFPKTVCDILHEHSSNFLASRWTSGWDLRATLESLDWIRRTRPSNARDFITITTGVSSTQLDPAVWFGYIICNNAQPIENSSYIVRCINQELLKSSNASVCQSPSHQRV